MRKTISLFFILGFMIFCKQIASAVLTNQAPTKHQNVNRELNNQNTNKTTTSQGSTTKKTSVPAISSSQKKKYYNDYINYLEQTIKDLGCFSSEEISKANVTVNLTFNSNYNVTYAGVGIYSIYGVDIDRETYNNKAKRCESKLFVTNFKPFDQKYSDEERSTKKFFIKLVSSEAQRREAVKAIIKLSKEYFYPPNDTSNCIAKIVLTFRDEDFIIKSATITNSSGNSEYNQMAIAALKRINWAVPCNDFNHRNGDLTIYLKFNGKNIEQSSGDESYSSNNSIVPASKSYSSVSPSSIQFPTFEQSMYDY